MGFLLCQDALDQLLTLAARVTGTGVLMAIPGFEGQYMTPAGAPLGHKNLYFFGDDATLDAFGGTPEIDMILRMTGRASGRSAEYGIVNRHTMNVDESTRFYSTDFPDGGLEFFDRNNNGVLENPTNTGPSGFPTSANTDYLFEARTWSDMTACTNADFAPG